MYGDSKPTEDAIDRVVAKINKECVHPLRLSFLLLTFICSTDKKNKFSRKRANEDEGDITYINEANRVFNKKVRSFLLPNYSRLILVCQIGRYYDKYTSEIRDSFERGTAL